jgi:hypothetical protein
MKETETGCAEAYERQPYGVDSHHRPAKKGEDHQVAPLPALQEEKGEDERYGKEEEPGSELVLRDATTSP